MKKKLVNKLKEILDATQELTTAEGIAYSLSLITRRKRMGTKKAVKKSVKKTVKAKKKITRKAKKA